MLSVRFALETSRMSSRIPNEKNLRKSLHLQATFQLACLFNNPSHSTPVLSILSATKERLPPFIKFERMRTGYYSFYTKNTSSFCESQLRIITIIIIIIIDIAVEWLIMRISENRCKTTIQSYMKTTRFMVEARCN